MKFIFMCKFCSTLICSLLFPMILTLKAVNSIEGESFYKSVVSTKPVNSFFFLIKGIQAEHENIGKCRSILRGTHICWEIPSQSIDSLNLTSLWWDWRCLGVKLYKRSMQTLQVWWFCRISGYVFFLSGNHRSFLRTKDQVRVIADNYSDNLETL